MRFDNSVNGEGLGSLTRWTKRILETCAADFAAGEALLEGVFVQPQGTTLAVMSRAIGHTAGVRFIGSTRLEDNSEVGRASELPGSSAVVGVTNQRLILWDHSKLSGVPTRYMMSLPIAEVASVHTEPARTVYALLLGFRDGSSKLYEAPRIGNNPKRFATAFARRGAPAEVPL